MKLEFHPSALEDYEEAACHYSDCQEGLDLRFMECVESAFDDICETPTRFRLFEEDVRRCLVNVFPYAILYTIESNYVLIIAVMHCSREPGYWHTRVNRKA